jgi:hypothetical protein
MPKVDPETHEPMSDAPDQESAELRGGKGIDDLPPGANPTGSGGLTQKGYTSHDESSSSPSNTQGGGSN